MRNNHPAIIFATKSGGTTIDQDALGGNPFATALIQLASEERVSLQKFPKRLRALTFQGSHRHQVPQWFGWPERLSWSFPCQPGSRQERRAALVLVVSDYPRFGAAPLAGAATDERRIAAMLATHGFSVTQGVASTRAAILQALAGFARLAQQQDVAVIYSTGHGVEAEGQVYLLPGDYPFRKGYSQQHLQGNAVSISRVAKACGASKLNLVFFAGCRTLVSVDEH
jgi:hypothetical protein